MQQKGKLSNNTYQHSTSLHPLWQQSKKPTENTYVRPETWITFWQCVALRGVCMYLLASKPALCTSAGGGLRWSERTPAAGGRPARRRRRRCPRPWLWSLTAGLAEPRMRRSLGDEAGLLLRRWWVSRVGIPLANPLCRRAHRHRPPSGHHALQQLADVWVRLRRHPLDRDTFTLCPAVLCGVPTDKAEVQIIS